MGPRQVSAPRAPPLIENFNRIYFGINNVRSYLIHALARTDEPQTLGGHILSCEVGMLTIH